MLLGFNATHGYKDQVPSKRLLFFEKFLFILAGTGGTVLLPPREEDTAGRHPGGSAAGAVAKAVCAREISRPCRRLKPGLTTLASAFSLDGENAPPRVQAVAEPGKMRVSVRWRWDLNPRRGCPLTRFRGVRPRPLGDSTAAELT